MESIGSQLRQAREGRGISVSQAASATRIKYQHIDAIERDDFSPFAASAYARGFIKIYAEYLGLDPAPLLEVYRDRHAQPERRPSLIDDTRRERAPARRDPPAPAPARREPPPPAEGPDDAAPRPAGLDGLIPPGLVKRVLLPAAGVVLLVLLAVSVSRLLRGGDADGAGGGAGSSVQPVWLEPPPEPYLPASGDEGGAP